MVRLLMAQHDIVVYCAIKLQHKQTTITDYRSVMFDCLGMFSLLIHQISFVFLCLFL